MSFSSEVKQELSKLSNLANKEMVKYEFLGYLATNHIGIEKNKIKFSTESEYNINRFGKLISNLDRTSNYEIELNGKNYCITSPKLQLEEIQYQENTIYLNLKQIENKTKKEELLAKAFVRGCFLGSGAINNPQNTYHLEILLADKEKADVVNKILKQYDIYFKKLKKKNGYALYTKEGDEISKFLALIQANKSVLQFEEIRVYRNIRNSVNRKVNCETANLNKTVNAAVKQIEAIKYLKSIAKFDDLPEHLKQIANLRLEHPDMPLQELGKLLSTPIGKSGVNHRLQAICKIAEEQMDRIENIIENEEKENKKEGK